MKTILIKTKHALTYTIPLAILISMIFVAGCKKKSKVVGPVVVPVYPASCSDAIDNDCDGLVDLNDTDDCIEDGAGEIDIILPNCSDGIDNDEDQVADADDSDCACGGSGEFAPPPALLNCDDTIDNDGDGDADADDSDCEEGGTGEMESVDAVVILPGNCEDGIDNDGDGNIDTDDTADCVEGGLGEQWLEGCNDGIDNDDDGTIDTADSESCGTGGTGELMQTLADVVPTVELEATTASLSDDIITTTNAAGETVVEIEENSKAAEIIAATSSLVASSADDVGAPEITVESQENDAAAVELTTAVTSLGGTGAVDEVVDLATPETQAVIETAIVASIESTGTIPATMETESIDDLMANVAEDPALSALLSSFSFDIGAGRLSRLDDYEECVADCGCTDCSATFTACAASCTDDATSCGIYYTNCLDKVDNANQPCLSTIDSLTTIANVVQTTCITKAEETNDNCLASAVISKDECSDFLDAAQSTCNIKKSEDLKANMTSAMGNFNDMYVIVTQLKNLELIKYAKIVEKLAMVLLVNQCKTNVSIYEKAEYSCMAATTTGEIACTLAHTANDSKCNVNVIGCESNHSATVAKYVDSCDTSTQDAACAADYNCGSDKDDCDAGCSTDLNVCGVECENLEDCIQDCHDGAGSSE